MPTDAAEFHEEAAAEYDAAFDWYRERSPDAAVKFDAEVDRALAHIIEAPRRWATGPALYSQVLAPTISVCSDLSGTDLGEHSDCGGCPHQPETWILEAKALTSAPRCNLGGLAHSFAGGFRKWGCPTRRGFRRVGTSNVAILCSEPSRPAPLLKCRRRKTTRCRRP